MKLMAAFHSMIIMWFSYMNYLSNHPSKREKIMWFMALHGFLRGVDLGLLKQGDVYGLVSLETGTGNELRPLPEKREKPRVPGAIGGEMDLEAREWGHKVGQWARKESGVRSWEPRGETWILHQAGFSCQCWAQSLVGNLTDASVRVNYFQSVNRSDNFCFKVVAEWKQETVSRLADAWITSPIF